MVYKNFVWLAMLCFVGGCASGQDCLKNQYAQTYTHAVQKEVQEATEVFQDGKLPYFHWSAPMVQEVNVPAHIYNGVFIPEHQEIVLIKPGQWVKESYEQKQEQFHHNTVADITSIPSGVSSTGNIK